MGTAVRMALAPVWPEANRRATDRVAMEQTVSIRMLDREAEPVEATTLNLSSSGVLVRTPQAFAARQPVSLVIAWPALVPGPALQLMATGHVTRCGGGTVAVSLDHAEFCAASARSVC